MAQQLLNWALESPLYTLLLVPQARRTMVQTAEANGIRWEAALGWIKSQATWDDDLLCQMSGDANYLQTIPTYYSKPFHAYETGNLNWEAAFEQELASRAVGARNFPAYGEAGEEAFRGAFESALASLGATVPKDGLMVDFGCGTGTSTRRLAANFPDASSVVGIDMSPYFVAVGRKLLEEAPGADGPWVTEIRPDERIKLSVGDAASTGLPDGCASTVSLTMVVHELPPEAAREVCAEALRILKPGGQLWISEMDFTAPAYAKLRANPLLFSLIRATEPYLDDYADSSEALFEHLAGDAGFASVRIAAATGRHFALIATKGEAPDDVAKKEASGAMEDLRFDTSGNYALDDTHLNTWESKSQER